MNALPIENASPALVIIGAVLSLIGLALAIAWLFLPFIISGRLSTMIKLAKAQQKTLDDSHLLLAKIEQHERLKR